jgi:DNA-directed RNA polymerase specialized sigma24 family protein
MAQRERVENWVGLLQRPATVRALDQLRRRKRKGRAMGGESLEAVMSEEREPGATAEGRELAEEFRVALGKLPGIQGQVYCLRHVSGMSYRE